MASASESVSGRESPRDDARGRVGRFPNCSFCSSGSKNTQPKCGEQVGRRASARGTGSRWPASSLSTTTTTTSYASEYCCRVTVRHGRDVARRDDRDNALVRDRDHDDRNDRRGRPIGGRYDRAMMTTTSDDESCRYPLDRRVFLRFRADV